MIPARNLEIAVLVLGMLVLLFGAFVRAPYHDRGPGYDDRLRARPAQFRWRDGSIRSRGIFRSAHFYLRRAYVHRFGNRFRDDFRFD